MKKFSIEVELSQSKLSENKLPFFFKKNNILCRVVFFFFSAVHEPSELSRSKAEK